ncbi:hypothetical protein [Trinickia fusca]|uniref:Uncharacterized protein n=1 Tax=Trinickia fusca TaxID=2419777 RepID=A0A494X1C9_9BURK|nr:hypothetical protein [Trinickia fusca]RKP44528.1 hypothetical protein D7S89_21820 [Trinickia fusca]
MTDETDSATLEAVFEEEAIAALRRLFDTGAGSADDTEPRTAYGVPTQPSSMTMPMTWVGEVIDTHHPEAMGCIKVRWADSSGAPLERWLTCLRNVKPRRGERVLLEQPGNWPEPLIVGTLDAFNALDAGSADTASTQDTERAASLKLEPGQCVSIADAQGKVLMQVQASPEGPVVRFLEPNVAVEAAGKLRLAAQMLELEGGRGGIDMRTEADAVVRARYIRLN